MPLCPQCGSPAVRREEGPFGTTLRCRDCDSTFSPPTKHRPPRTRETIFDRVLQEIEARRRQRPRRLPLALLILIVLALVTVTYICTARPAA